MVNPRPAKPAAKAEHRTPLVNGMGRHIIAKTGNVARAAAARAQERKNAAYSLQYARITGAELQDVIDERQGLVQLGERHKVEFLRRRDG